MALANDLPGGWPARPTSFYGIQIFLTPANPLGLSLQFEIQRAPDLNGAPDTGNAASVLIVGPFPASGDLYQDALPNDGVKRWYRARHVGDTVDAGAWSGWVGDVPYQITQSRFLPQKTGAPDGMSATSSWQNPQGSTPVSLSTNAPFTAASACPSVSGRGSIYWSWSAFTVYRADGSTISVPASSTGATPAAPTLSQVAAGALGARTRRVIIALCKDSMLFGCSGETQLAVNANNLLKVTSPAAVTGYDGWIPLVCDATVNAEVMQPSLHPDTPIAFGVDWTEPVGGATINDGNRTQHNDQNQNTGAQSWDLAASTTYHFYPYWDVVKALIAFAGGHGTAKSEAKAQSQNADGHIGLSAGSITCATPAVGGSGGNAGGGSGSCLAPAMLVEVAGRGVICAADIAAGDELRAPGGWRRVRRVERRAQAWMIEVTVANGSIARVTPTHPFTTEILDAPCVAEDLKLNVLLVVPDGFAEVTAIRRVVAQEKIVLELDGDHTFWAGMEPGRWILCHNAQIGS